MGKQAAKRSRLELATELLLIADLLEREGICPDAAPLKSAANQCKTCGGDHWGYDISNLILRLGGGNQTIPASLSNLDCRLNVSASGLCSQIQTKGDPMTALSIDVVLEGTVQSSQKKHIQSWHFDRHVSAASSAEPTAAHPRYHFHFGGRQMEAFMLDAGADCFDSLLLLDGPRISHAPLDGVLIIDFILSNFVGEKWRTLRDNQGYSRIVKASQSRNWKPFITALARHLPESTGMGDWHALDVWPHLCES